MVAILRIELSKDKQKIRNQSSNHNRTISNSIRTTRAELEQTVEKNSIILRYIANCGVSESITAKND